MIRTRSELKECLRIEKQIYFKKITGKRAFAQKLVHSKNAIIYKYIKLLRHEEYYKNNQNGILEKALLAIYKRKKNILGQSLGFDIPAGCFDYGLTIHHVGGGSNQRKSTNREEL